ncbi:dUTP diphosphatase [Crassaminicella indica]|uniref:dUTP diphosphatase n=1 Tax=Crassaminicella indica TaxID=2855394 RepID=A0ABX8RBW3_9CLOT|nr:dUTP diphosphatase [Crassaminicella indica]QXM06301.1 dUTP diphosphatase [Crassaminicella indica]
MDLNQLFKVQEIIENNIKQFTDIKEDTLGKENVFDLRFLALQVKTGEIANLTKCYKYFKVKENIPKEKLMIRYIDALKFLLSIGNVHHFNVINGEAINSIEKENSIIKLFSYIFDDIKDLKHAILQDDYVLSLSIYVRLFARFINLGELLGFSFQEVYNYYVEQA